MDKKSKLFIEWCDKLEMKEAQRCDDCPPDGHYYVMNKNKGSGYYWFYMLENYFFISVMDLVFYEDCYMEYIEPQYLSVYRYDSISGHEINPYRRLVPNQVKVRVGNNNVHQIEYHKNIPIRSTAIILFPEYQHKFQDFQYLYSEAVKDRLPEIFSESSELTLLLRQIKNCRLCDAAAKIFYESKAAEAMSIILNGLMKTKMEEVCAVTTEDYTAVAMIKEYINNHFQDELNLSKFARMSCMCPTKLKYIFKKVTKRTIFEYITEQRISFAERMLSTTNLTIQEIANLSGYKKSGSFSDIFKKETGLLPSEYRKCAGQ